MPPKKLGPSQLLAGDGAGDGSVVVGGIAVVLLFGECVVDDGLIVVDDGLSVVDEGLTVVVVVVVVDVVVDGFTVDVVGIGVVVVVDFGSTVVTFFPDGNGSGLTDNASGFSWWTSASGDLTSVELAAAAADAHATASSTNTVVFNRTILSSVR
jgi:hypothetical protein